MVYIETSIDLLWVYSLRLHFNYVSKIFLKHADTRLTKITALEIINKNTSWFLHWRDLFHKYSCPFDISLANVTEWKVHFDNLIAKIGSVHREESVRHALASSRFLLYKELDFSCCFFNPKGDSGGLSLNFLKWLLKLRCELLYLNFIPWLEREVEICALCNSRAKEDAFHFLAECSILVELRLLYLGHRRISRAHLTDLLNTKTCTPLIQYARHAWKYRYELIQHFNF